MQNKMESPPRLALLLLLVIVYSAVAVPLSRNNGCARHCTESNRFHFQHGVTYTYDYDTSTTTLVKGTSKEKSQLQMRAQVDIEVISKCELSLRLRGVTLKQTDPESPDYLSPIKGGREFSRTVERQILRFSWQDGRIEEVCPSEEAPAWVTNIQRGILSALQNSMASLEKDERVVETDVAGKCPVEYHSLGRSWRGVLRIRKQKDLNSCTDRHNVDTSLQAIPFTHGSDIQSQPLVSGSQECEQSVGDGIVQSSTCTEKHVFRPFSKGDGGVTTMVHQKLTYVTSGKRTFTGNDYRSTREGLLFKHESRNEASARSNEEAEMALRQLCQASQDEVTISVPEQFASFVYKLKKLNFDSLGAFFRNTDALCPKAKKFFMDAIPIVATEASVHFMAAMISRQEVPEAEANFWFTSLSFVTEPTTGVIAALTPLVDGRYEQALLGVSSLVHTFCKNTDCGSIPEVRALVHRLVDNLGETCYNPDFRKILLTLKAIGNIGQPFGREKILERCYKNPQLKVEVRLAAIQAFRRFGCDVPRETFLKTYSNYNEISEIRIASYLTVMSCMTSTTLQEVKETLEREQVNQVGSFVWTHLQALAKSRHPERQDIKEIVSSLYLLNKYQSDIRKFSSAHENSFYLDSINSGLHVDTHLIFPTHSYLPHSATFNLTVDIFGHSCNLLQLDGRMEGIEHVMERFFGPSGYFPQKHVSKLLRHKRSISDNKIEKMDEQFDAKSKFEEKPYGSLDVKIFGNTLWYRQFEESDDSQSASNFMDIIAELAEKQEKEFSRSFMFLDTSYAIPMASGLPLRLDVNGTASVNMKLGGRFNVRSLQNVDILAHIEPSGAIQLAGLLTVEAGNAARTGMRISATLHSSTVMDTKVEVRNGEVVKAEINVPRERINIVDLQTRLYLVYGIEEREPQGQQGFHMQSCTPSDSVKQILGVELCADIRLPGGKSNTPIYPMNGPSTVSIYLHKTDPTLTKYTFDAAWENKMLNGQYIRQGSLSLNTPQSRIDREVKLHFLLNQPDGTFVLEAKTPVRKLSVKAKYANTVELKKLDMSVTVDEKDRFALRSEFRRKMEKGGINYVPSLEISVPEKKLVTVTGSANMKHGQKYNGQLVIQDLTQKAITLKGSLDMKDNNRQSGEISVSSYALDATMKGHVQIGGTILTKIVTDYKIMDGKPQKHNINLKVRDLSLNSLTKYSGVLNVQSTEFPEYDTSVSWEAMKTVGHLENTLSFAIGDGTKTRMHTINIQEIIKYRGGLYDNNAEVTLKLNYPEKNLNYAFQMKHENTDRTLKNVLEFQYATNRQITTTTTLAYDPDKSFNGDIGLKYPGREAKLMVEFTEVKSREYKGSTTFQWQHGKKISFMAHYRDRSEGSRMRHETEVEIIVPSKEPITLAGSINAHGNQYAAFIEMNYGLEKYRINGKFVAGRNFDHQLSGTLLLPSESYSIEQTLQSDRNKLTGTMILTFPKRRRISTKFELKDSQSIKTGFFETSWDADRDPSKKFGVNGELKTNPNGYDAKLMMQIERKNFIGYFSTNTEGNLYLGNLRAFHKAQIEWSPNQKASLSFETNMFKDVSRRRISSKIEINTPYLNYETMTFSLIHSNTHQDWNCDLSTIWGRNKKFTLSSEGKYSYTSRSASMDAIVKVRSPWPRYEMLSFNVSHYYDPIEFSNKMQLQWSPREKIVTEMTHTVTETGFKCGIRATTPFQNAQDLHAAINHNVVSGGYKTKMDIQWAPRKNIDAELDLKHVLSGRRRMCSLNLLARSSFNNFEYVSSKIVYNNDGTTINTDSEVHFNRQKLTMGLMGVRRNSYYNKNMEMKLYFTSPFEGYNDLQVTSSFQMTPDSYNFNIHTKTPYDTSVTFDSTGKFLSWQNIEINGILNSQLPLITVFNRYIDLQKVAVDFVHKYQNSNLRSSFDGIYNDKQITVLLTGMIQQGYKAYNIEGSLSAKTPFRGYENINIDFAHNRKDMELTTKIDVIRNRDNFNLVKNLNVKDKLNFEGEMVISYVTGGRSVKKFKSSYSQVYHSGYFSYNHVSEFTDWGSKKKEINIIYENKIAGKELNINLKLPYGRLRNFDLSAEHQTGRNEYKTRFTAEWNGNKKIRIQQIISNDMFRRMNIDFSATSNVYGPQNYQLSAKYDVTTSRKTLDFSYNEDQKEVLSMKSSLLVSQFSPELLFTLSTPFSNFEKISLMGKGENKPYEKQGSIVYERNNRKIETKGKFLMTDNLALCEVSLRSPMRNARNLHALAKYQKLNGGFSGEILAEWNDVKKLSAVGSFTKAEKNFETKMTISTPFYNYEVMSFDASADISGRNNRANFILRRNKDKIELLMECEVKRGREGNFKVQFTSPFRHYEKIVTTSSYKKNYDEYEATINLDAGQQKQYNGEMKFTRDNVFKLKVTTPHYPYRTIEFDTEFKNEDYNQLLKSCLKWEEKKIDVLLTHKLDTNNKHAIQFRITTPFSSFRNVELKGNFQNQGMDVLEGDVELVTPFQSLPQFTASGRYKSDRNFYDLQLTTRIPAKTVTISGQMSNNLRRPFQASLSVDAPFANLNNIVVKIQIDHTKGLSDATAELEVIEPRSTHTLTTKLQARTDVFFTEISASSPLISGRTMSLNAKANYGDVRNMDAEGIVNVFNQRHGVTAKYKQRKQQDYLLELKADSPALQERTATLKVDYTQRRKLAECKVIVQYSGALHSFIAKGETDNTQISGIVTINSHLLNPSSIEINGKYINGNGRDLEFALTANTGGTKHSLIAGVKNYDGEKFLQLEVNCPLLEVKQLSVTGTLKNEGYNAIDGVLTISARDKELRLAGNMKKNSWNNMEAFLTVNTPYDQLRMMRIDVGFKNDNLRNLEANLQLETSNNNLRHLGFVGKLIRTHGSEDLSLVIRLPHPSYSKVQFLGNVHYDSSLSAADSRLTLSLPYRTYSAYGRYQTQNNGISVDGEYEYENQKYAVSGQARIHGNTKGISAIIQLPRRGSYAVGANMDGGYGRHSVSVSYSDPHNKPFNASLNVDYVSVSNINIGLVATTPFDGYNHVNLRFRHQRDGRKIFFADVEYSADERRAFLNMFHRYNNTDYLSSVRVGSPLSILKDLEASFVKNRGHECTLDVSYNGNRCLKGEMSVVRGVRNYLLDMPSLPLTVSAKVKPATSGRELVIKSNYPTRTMSLSLLERKSSHFWSQETVLVWDESAHQQISYNIKLADAPKGQPWGKELFARINFPVRSLELKGKLTESGKVRSGGMDFFWDASRDSEKHLAIGVEHQDISTRDQILHKLQATLTHPALPRDLELLSVLSMSSTEFLCLSELQYSRHQERHLVAELRATDLLPRQKDSHYKAELSLRHPINQLDVRATGEVTDNNAEMTTHFRLTNMNRRRRVTLQEIKAKIFKVRQQIELMMRSNEDQMSILGKVTDVDGETMLSLNQKINGQNGFQSLVRLDRGLRSIDVNMTYANTKGILLGASYRHEEANLRIQHFNDINTVTDLSAYLGLEKSRILRSKASWKPGMWRDLRIATGDTLRGLSYKASNVMNAYVTEFQEESRQKMQEVGKELKDKLKPFIYAISRDMEDVNRDLVSGAKRFKIMYGNNEFFAKDIVRGFYITSKALRDFCDIAVLFSQMMMDLTMNYLEELYETLYYDLEDFVVYMRDICSNAFASMNKMYKQISTVVVNSWDYICDKTIHYMGRMCRKMGEFSRNIKENIENYVRRHAPCILDAYYYIRITTDNIRTGVNNAMTSLKTSVTSHSFYIALNDYFNRLATTIRTFQTADLVSTLQSRVLFFGERANVFLSELSDMQVVDLIRDRIPVDYIADRAKVTLQKGVELYTTLGIDRLLSGIFDYAWEQTKTLALSSGQDLLHEFYLLKTGAKYELDTRRGSFSFEYTLPTSKNSIYEVFHLAKYPEMRKIGELKKYLLKKYYEDFCIWDIYYKVKNYFTTKNWMPPFTAHAMIAGNQHYVTFDKLAFDFAGECSYLLARDFVDGNFTVVANYKREASKAIRKSLTILLEGRKYEIVNDYKLTLDDVKVELPIRVGHTVATRQGPNVRIENDHKGFVVVCNFVHDVCTVGMSGFYFAKTGGLFGTYDYEPHLDMMTPEKSIASDIEAFANSWEVGKTFCRSSNNLATIPGNDQRVYEKCNAMFAKTSSPFRACFKQVDPQPYLSMCINDLSSVHENQFDSTICISAAAYFTECKIENVHLKMPKLCVHCETTTGKKMMEGDILEFTNDNPTHTADVVFVVEEKKCNHENFKYLSKLAHSIEDNFRQKGFLDIRYRVVGFGGEDIHSRPHIHTMDGQEHGSIRSIDSAFQSLVTGEGPVNMLEALRFAAALDFRPGTSKNFILIKCSTCKAEEGKAGYGEMLRILQDGEINLHLLMEQKYEMRISNKNSKAKKVIGLDKNFAYTLKDIKDSNVFGDGDLLVQLKAPKDICIPLALEVNGSTFDSQYLTETKRNTNKKFMDVLARRMLKSASHARNDGALCCECMATENGVGKSTCQKCVALQSNFISYYSRNGQQTTSHSQNRDSRLRGH